MLNLAAAGFSTVLCSEHLVKHANVLYSQQWRIKDRMKAEQNPSSGSWMEVRQRHFVELNEALSRNSCVTTETWNPPPYFLGLELYSTGFHFASGFFLCKYVIIEVNRPNSHHIHGGKLRCWDNVMLLCFRLLLLGVHHLQIDQQLKWCWILKIWVTSNTSLITD